MAEYTVTIAPFPEHKLGDRWIGVQLIGPIEIDEETPAEKLVKVEMVFKKGNCTMLFSSDEDNLLRDGIATILDDDVWTATVPPTDTFLPSAGTWNWVIKLYREGQSAPLTPYQGSVVVNKTIKP